MNKGIIKKILIREKITQSELIEFILDYCKLFDKPEPTGEQLQGIIALVQQNIFNIMYAAEIAAIKNNMYVMKIFKENFLLKTIVYE